MCGACKMTCCIDPSGNVFPCAFLQDMQFCGGNLRETPTSPLPLRERTKVRGNNIFLPRCVSAGDIPVGRFKDIWDNAAAFLRFRSLEPAACRACPRFEKCRGGCPAVAYFLTKDLDSADPECMAKWSWETKTT